jgi:hypothetical protein
LTGIVDLDGDGDGDVDHTVVFDVGGIHVCPHAPGQKVPAESLGRAG